MVGITLFSWVADKAGFPLPEGMGTKHLLVTAIIAGLGLTVALFVAGKAYDTRYLRIPLRWARCSALARRCWHS